MARGFPILLVIVVFLGCSSPISIAKEWEAGTWLGTVIGIDLGTTYSRFCFYKDGVIVAKPSWVAFSETERLIGEEAAKNDTAILYDEKTIFSYSKRLMGRKFEDKEVQRIIKFSPYKIVNKDGKPCIEVKIRDGICKVFSPEEITAMFLNKMKETAEASLGKKIKNAVVTVPAYYNDAQRRATTDAGIMAGLRVASVVSEPAAAAISYSLHREEGQRILIFDLGGETFDVSILKFDNGAFKVLTTSGDANLGGKDLDRRIMEYFIKLIGKKQGKDITKNNEALVKLRRECERAKIALTSQFQVQVEIGSLFDDGVGFSEPLTREQFEELNKDPFNKTMEHVKKAIENAGLEKHQIDHIILAGGSSMIPKVQQLLKDYFDGKKLYDWYPDNIVVEGAALLGAYLSTKRGERREIVLHRWDSEPLSLGIGTAGGVMKKLIPREIILPTKKSQVFTTRKDFQTSVYEGESRFTKFCKFLGSFNLTGIPPAPRGSPRIEVTFELDGETNLYVKAEDKRSGKSENITIHNVRHLLSEEEMNRILYEAAKSAKEERKMKERNDQRIVAFDNLETYVCETANQIFDKYRLGDKLESSGEKEKIESAVREAMEWLADNQNAEKEDYQQKLKEVEAVCNPIIESVYRASGGAPQDDH